MRRGNRGSSRVSRGGRGTLAPAGRVCRHGPLRVRLLHLSLKGEGSGGVRARSAARRRGRSLRPDSLGSVARRARRCPRLDRLHPGCTTGAGVRATPVRRRSLRSSGRTARRGAWRDGDWNPGQTAGAELLLKLGKLSLPQVDTDGARVMARSAEKAVREGQWVTRSSSRARRPVTT